MTRFTIPQRRALLLLPPDGSWLVGLGSNAQAVDRLRLYYPDLVEIENGRLDHRLIRRGRRARLTAAGIAARAAIEGEGG